MKTRLSILLLCSSLFANFAGAENYDGLVVIEDYKKLPILIANHNEDRLKTDLIKSVVKLKLLSNNLRPQEAKMGIPHGLVVSVSWTPDNLFYINVQLIKYTEFYVEEEFHFLGPAVYPHQGEYVSFGDSTDESRIIKALRSTMDNFLVDYLESNLAMVDLVERINQVTPSTSPGPASQSDE
jgi:hypothetical protein